MASVFPLKVSTKAAAPLDADTSGTAPDQQVQQPCIYHQRQPHYLCWWLGGDHDPLEGCGRDLWSERALVSGSDCRRSLPHLFLGLGARRESQRP